MPRDRTCCDGECNQGRDCPLSPRRLEAAKPREPRAQRRRVDPVRAATWTVVLVTAVTVACAIAYVVLVALS